VTEKMGKRETLPETLLNSAIGSPESRAAARARCERRGAADVVIRIVRAPRRDIQGQIIPPQPPKEIASASCGGVSFPRLAGESETELIARALAGRPLSPQIVVLHPAGSPR
jgi:hypothetical protein